MMRQSHDWQQSKSPQNTRKILHHSRGRLCHTFCPREFFWLAQPSRQGWLGLLHVFTENTFFYTFKELACALYERFYFPLDSRSLCDFSSTPSASLFLCCFSFSATARSLSPI